MTRWRVCWTGMPLWKSQYGTFIRYAQNDYCKRLIVVPLSTFHRMAEVLGDPKGEVIFLFNTGRCGSTLLTQVCRRSCHWVVSSEISAGKFPQIYSNFSTNFRKFVNYLCHSAFTKSSIAKWCCKISMFFTNNSPDLCALTLCIMFRKE